MSSKKFEELSQKEIFSLDMILEILDTLREIPEEDARTIISAMYDVNRAPDFVRLIEELYNRERAKA